MDRRQRKTREAIFSAFARLLAQKHFAKITVGDIIDEADIGRATFYAHFETKDYLLKDFCEELFCHIFDSAAKRENGHRHIFDCDGEDSVILHLLRHLQKNDNNILALLTSDNNELFLGYFRRDLEKLMEDQLETLGKEKYRDVPAALLKSFAAAAFLESVKWWIANGMTESPETVAQYFYTLI